MIDHFAALSDALDAHEKEEAAKMSAAAEATRRAKRGRPAPPPPPGGFDGVMEKAQHLAKSLAPRRNYSAELDSILAKAMAGFAAGSMTAFDVSRLEDKVERTRHDCIVKGLI